MLLGFTYQSMSIKTYLHISLSHSTSWRYRHRRAWMLIVDQNVFVDNVQVFYLGVSKRTVILTDLSVFSKKCTSGETKSNRFAHRSQTRTVWFRKIDEIFLMSCLSRTNRSATPYVSTTIDTERWYNNKL